MNDQSHSNTGDEPDEDRLPAKVQADVDRWRAAQPAAPDVDSLAWPPDRPRRHVNRRRRLVTLSTAAAIAVAAAGTVLTINVGHHTNSNEGIGVRLVGQVQPLKLGAVTPQDIAKAQTAFGLDLLARQCAMAPTANDVLSPASAAFTLAMLASGASGATQQAITDLLHLPSWSPSLVAGLNAQQQALTGLTQFQVSNHIYTQLGVHPQQQVLNDLATAEDAYLQTLDFAGHPTQATNAINAAVNADTRGLIHKLFDEPLDPTTTTVLTNALYLNADWKTPFPPAYPSQFHTATGNTVTTPTMSNEHYESIRQVDGWTSAVLPYVGGKLEAVVLLPPNTANAVAGTACAAPTATQLAALTTGPAVLGPVTMPKLHLTQTHPLTADLATLGLPLAGDYSGFGTTGGISKVVQKTVLQVDEHGTKAAAATGGAIAASGPLYTLTADRPYLLLIRDVATGTPLFLTRINDPTVN